jgi:folate-binding protein YgfZ
MSAVVVPRDVVLVRGPDALTYLQGQLSQDVAALDVGGSAFSLLLQPQGKVDAWLRVTRIAEDGFALDVDAGWGEHVLARLKRFLLRVKVELEQVEWQVTAGGDPPPGAWAVVAELGEGHDVLSPTPVPGAEADPGYELRRIRAGVPRMGRELDESTIPAAAGVVDRSVSFTKGCYTGQELVARIDSRGDRVPTKLRRVSGEIEAGDELVDGDREIGRVTSAVDGEGLAYVRREVEPPATVRTRRGGAVQVLVALVLLLVLSACASSDRYAPLPRPDDGDAAPTTATTSRPDLDEVALPAVPGRTTTTAAILGPGPVTIVGRVDGPDGPVPGAIVQLERLVGSAVASTRVPTATDGTWNLQNVLGGQYRIRAWLPPAFGMERAQLVFVEAPKPKAVILRLDRFEGIRVDGAIAPNPPTVDDDANLKVRVARRQVGEDGVIRSVPVAGTQVVLSGSGSWSVRSSTTGFTGSDGSVVFRVVCRDAGVQPLSVVLENGEVRALELPGCVDEEATTTTTSSSTSTTSDDDDD